MTAKSSTGSRPPSCVSERYVIVFFRAIHGPESNLFEFLNTMATIRPTASTSLSWVPYPSHEESGQIIEVLRLRVGSSQRFIHSAQRVRAANEGARVEIESKIVNRPVPEAVAMARSWTASSRFRSRSTLTSNLPTCCQPMPRTPSYNLAVRRVLLIFIFVACTFCTA